MRIWHRMLIVLVLLTLVTGCDEIESLFPQQEEGLPSAFVAPTTEAAYPAEMSTAARVLARGELVVGVRYDLEPFSYINASSELAGLEIDLARELARRWLGNAEAVRFKQVRSDTAFDHLARGSVDVVFAGLTHTQADEANADFSPAYFTNGMALLTFPDTQVRSVYDLEGHNVGVVNWTDSYDRLDASVPVSTTYTGYDNYLDLVEGLRMRYIDVYGDARHRLERAQRSLSGSVIVGQFSFEPMAMIFRQNDPFFNNLVILTFQDMVRDGTYAQLYARWLPNTTPPVLQLMPGSETTPVLGDSPQQISTLDVISRIRARGTVNVGYYSDRYPYSGVRADGVPTGFEIRLVEYLGEQWLGSRDAVVLVPVNDGDALAHVNAGDVDILIGGQVHTRESELRYDHSMPILDDGVSLLSMADNPVSALSQLGGQSVAVVNGSDGEAAVAPLSQGIGLSAQGYPTFADAVAALENGEVVAVLTERRPALDVQFRDERFFISEQRYTYRPITMLLPEGDSAFRDLVNLTLLDLQSRGVYQELYTLWFDDAVFALETWPGSPAYTLVISQ